MKKAAILLLKIYKSVVSPYVPTTCRFYPTCSSYMLDAIEQKGLLKGLLKGMLRIVKCHPFHPGGYDPVK